MMMMNALATHGPRPSINVNTLCTAPPYGLVESAPSSVGWLPDHHFFTGASSLPPTSRSQPYGPGAFVFSAASSTVNTPNSAVSSGSDYSATTYTSASSLAQSPPTPPSSTFSSSPASSRSYPLRRPAFKKAAMSGRPANKRAADGGGSDEDSSSAGAHAGTPKVKLPRMDRGPGEFSNVVKSRLQSYTRTGQACDRCKVRKIRCDALAEGCSHCINLSLECYVTDRVSGRTERRGYLQELEREKSGMTSHIRDLEKLLQEKGIEVKPWQGAALAQYHPDITIDDMGNAMRDASNSEEWSQTGTVWVKNGSSTANAATSSIPQSATRLSAFMTNFSHGKLESLPAQSHIGVGGDNSPLSSIGGTRLTIFGTTIDTASFDAPDIDEPPANAQNLAPLYNKSVQAFLQSTMKVNPSIQANLPARDEAFMMSDWYFRTVSTFLPLLHKPTYMRLLTRIYDEPNFEPSVPELVIVHMVLATIYFQYGVRNCYDFAKRNGLNESSNKHYHYALSKMFDLYSSNELIAVQAMTLMASHTRAFPKPGCGAIIANMALNRAIELNLHRAVKRPGGGTDLQNELRKRTWWVTLTVVVAVAGRRGCPIPISVDDFDTEFPEPVADEHLSDEGIDAVQTIPCPYQAGLAGFKIIPIYLQMYSTIYAVRRNAANYVSVVRSLEEQLQEWVNALPDCLKLTESGTLDQHEVAALYVKTFELELRLCLRHPSVAMTTDAKMMAENSRICDETAREFLDCVQKIYKMKALDTTWYQMSIYAACLFSSLVARWEKRFETTPEQVTSLRQDMDMWMTIVKETSLLLGCGPRIPEEISHIIDRTIGWIEHDMQGERPKETLPVASSTKQERQPHQSAYQATQPAPAQPDGVIQSEALPKEYYQESSMNSQAAHYSGLAYSDQAQTHAPAPAYQSDNGMFYNAAQQQQAVAAAGAGAASNASTSGNPLANFASQPSQHATATQSPVDMMWASGRGTTWHDWSAAIADTQDQDRFSANALLHLGGGARVPVASPALADVPLNSTGDIGVVPHGSQWPMIMFDHATTTGP